LGVGSTTSRFRAITCESPRQLRNALLYVLNNSRHHDIHHTAHLPDAYSSGGHAGVQVRPSYLQGRSCSASSGAATGSWGPARHQGLSDILQRGEVVPGVRGGADGWVEGRVECRARQPAGTLRGPVGGPDARHARRANQPVVAAPPVDGAPERPEEPTVDESSSSRGYATLTPATPYNRPPVPPPQPDPVSHVFDFTRRVLDAPRRRSQSHSP